MVVEILVLKAITVTLEKFKSLIDIKSFRGCDVINIYYDLIPKCITYLLQSTFFIQVHKIYWVV